MCAKEESLFRMVLQEKQVESTNLISINQLCDQGLNVSFTKGQCIVTNND